MDHIKPTGTTMKKIIVMLVLAASALVGMATTAGALSAVHTQLIGREGVGDSGREWACAGNDQWKEAVCVGDPVPASSIRLQP